MTQNAGTFTIEYHDGRGFTGVSDPLPFNASASLAAAAFFQAGERAVEAAL